MRKIELEGCAPGIEDFAFVIEVGPADGEDEDFFLGLTQESLGNGNIIADGIAADELPILLDPEDEVIRVRIELNNFRIDVFRVPKCPTFSHPEDTGDPDEDENRRENAFHNISFFGALSYQCEL